MSVIDVHAHHLPSAIGERFTELSGRPYPLRHSDDHSRRIRDLDDAEIDTQVLSLGAVQPYWTEGAASTTAARFANDLYAEIVSSNGDRFRAFGAVPLPHVDAAAEEAIRCLDELNFDGIGLGCSAAGIALDDSRFDAFWNELDRRSAIVYLHPGVANDGLVGVSEYPMLLGPVFGSPAEQSVAVTRLLLKGVPGRCPNITFLVAGMGGNLLVAQHKLMESLDRAAEHNAEAPRSADIIRDLRRIYFDTSSMDPVLALAAREFGAVDQLVFGSDSPWGSAVRATAALRESLSADETTATRNRADQILINGKAIG